MNKKKIYACMSKLAIATIIATSLASTGYAADGDLWMNSEKKGTTMDIVKSSQKRMHLIKNRNDYTYELDGKLYNVMEVDGVFKENPTADQNTVFDIIKENLQVVGTIPTEDKELKVESVSAINATQVEVKFNKAVDKDTLFTNGKSGAFKATVSLMTLDGDPYKSGVLEGELSKDGKTLTVTAAKKLEKRYDVVIDDLKSVDGDKLAKYEEMITIKADTTAPTIVSTDRISSNMLVIKFSEPVTGGEIKALYADGTAIDPVLTLAVTGETELEVDLSDEKIEIDKDIVITFNGVADMAGNLIDPQPSKVTVVKEKADGIEPAITSVEQTGAKTFSIKFSKDLKSIAETDVTVATTKATSMKKISASKYEFTMAANLDGLQTVTVEAGTAVDLAGQSNEKDLTKVFNFAIDKVAPKATAKLITHTDNKEYVELTFDKNVTLGGVSLDGEKIKDFVTSEVTSKTADVVYADATKKDKKVVLVPLAWTGEVEGAEFDLTISSTEVKSEAGIKMDDVKVKFTRGKDGIKEEVNDKVVTKVVIEQKSKNNNEINVTFTIPAGTKLDGKTATNVENYSVAGAEIESVTLKSVDATEAKATINLKKDSNTFTGKRNVVIKNVKIAGSTKVMDPVTINTVELAENVRPTVTDAEVTKIVPAEDKVPAVTATATVDIVADATTKVTKGDLTSAITTPVTEYKIVKNESKLDLQKADTTVVQADIGGITKTFTQGGVIFTVLEPTDGDTFTIATTAKVEEKAATKGETIVTLSFSEKVKRDSEGVDFELFIDGKKQDETVTTAKENAMTGADKLVVTIADKALTAADFAKGVELRVVKTPGIKDVAGNVLNVEAPIKLGLN